MKKSFILLLLFIFTISLSSCKDPVVDEEINYDESIVGIYQLTLRDVNLSSFIKKIDGPFTDYTEGVIYMVSDQEIKWSHESLEDWYTVLSLDQLSGSTNALYRLQGNIIEYSSSGSYTWETLLDLESLVYGDTFDYKIKDDYLVYYTADEWIPLCHIPSLYDDVDDIEYLDFETIYNYYLTTHPNYNDTFEQFMLSVKNNHIDVRSSTAPNITLNGPQIILLFQDEVYIEHGALWSDNLDGNGIATSTSDLDVSTIGDYIVEYSYTDSNQNTTTITRSIVVVSKEAALATGVYDLNTISDDKKYAFLAAAESYILDNIITRIPIASGATYTLYSPRVLPANDYGFSFFDNQYLDIQLLLDDSSVTFDHTDSVGNEGEYTARIPAYNSLRTYNPYYNQDYNLIDLLALIHGTLYEKRLNETQTGYSYQSYLAKSNPIPISPIVESFGAIRSTSWKIEVKDDLVWSFYGDEQPNYVTDNSITANDFVQAIKIAIDNDWDSLYNSHSTNVINQIENIQQYKNGSVSWSEVGLKAIDNNIIITSQYLLSEDEIVQTFSNTHTTPINVEMYDMLGDSYFSTPGRMAYSGHFKPNYSDEEIPSTVNKYEKNVQDARPRLNNFTHILFILVGGGETTTNMFNGGYLDVFPDLPTNQEIDYQNHPGFYATPDTTTTSLIINNATSIEELYQLSPESTYEIKPILSNENFRKSIYYAINRINIVDNYLTTSIPHHTIFTQAHIMNQTGGVPYRNSDQGINVSSNYSPETYGFDLIKAKMYFDLAIEELVQNGSYPSGTFDNYNTIQISLSHRVLYELDDNLVNFLENSLEAALVNDTHYIKIDIVTSHITTAETERILQVKEYDILLDYQYNNNSVMLEYIESYSNTYDYNDKINQSIDTNTASLKVQYNDDDNIRHIQLWSFDAIIQAMTIKSYIHEGAIPPHPTATIISNTVNSTTFTISNVDNPIYKNITYFVYYRDPQQYGRYLNEYFRVPITEDTITITDYANRENYSFWFGTGTYQIFIFFEYNIDTELLGHTTSMIWSALPLYTEVVNNNTDTIINNTVIFDSTIEETITSIELFDDEMNPLSSTSTLTDNTYTITNLSPNTTYIVKIVLSDGQVDHIITRTNNSNDD